jgi:hypothetical protein
MGCFDFIERELRPCANCGKEGGGFMSSGAWQHDYMCCSDRCGFRLKQKIENRMTSDKQLNRFYCDKIKTEAEELLRNRIRQLKHRLKRRRN